MHLMVHGGSRLHPLLKTRFDSCISIRSTTTPDHHTTATMATMEFQHGLAFLDSDQATHYERCKRMLIAHRFYIDQSVMGSGKTYVGLALAQSMGLSLMVIGPKSSLAMWEEKAAEYHVPMHLALSYQALTGVGKGQPKHGLLLKTREKDEHGDETISYAPLPKWTEQCKGVLVIVDEAHNCKNPGNKEKAVTAILNGVRAGSNAYYGLLSASLMDKDHMYTQFLRVLGFYTKRALTDNLKSTRPGYDEIVQHCRRVAPAATHELAYPPAVQVAPMALHENLYLLFTDVVLPACSSSMPDPLLPSKMSNVFYPVGSPVLKARLQKSYADLCAAVRYDATLGTVRMEKDSIAEVNKACMNHEWALAEVALREAWAWLHKTPTGKVIVFTNYKQTLRFVQTHLECSGVKSVPYEGRMTTNQRVAAVRAFQGDPATRAFVSNISCGGVAISLHDLVGNQPRLVLIFPTYKILDVYQATGRAVRRGMKTEADVRMVYSADYPLLHMFDALARKTSVLKAVNKGASNSTQRKYPGEFPTAKVPLNDGVQAGGDYSKAWHTEQDKSPYQDKFNMAVYEQIVGDEEEEEEEEE